MKFSNGKRWENFRIGITGANGSLGKALTRGLREKGASVIGLTHQPIDSINVEKKDGPEDWVQWSCGQENALKKTLSKVDILVLNHGINPKGDQSAKALNKALEINALSTLRLMEIFEEIVQRDSKGSQPRELWINTSEAEIQPALSPTYEISKRLIGEIVSLKWNNLNESKEESLIIRKLILGPFKSELNPLGIMGSRLVANQIIKQVELDLKLIIVTPNPITYVIMPIVELIRSTYSFVINKLYNKHNA